VGSEASGGQTTEESWVNMTPTASSCYPEEDLIDLIPVVPGGLDDSSK
jgi:hypothetical protein